jgi:hypothetical protein
VKYSMHLRAKCSYTHTWVLYFTSTHTHVHAHAHLHTHRLISHDLMLSFIKKKQKNKKKTSGCVGRLAVKRLIVISSGAFRISPKFLVLRICNKPTFWRSLQGLAKNSILRNRVHLRLCASDTLLFDGKKRKEQIIMTLCATFLKLVENKKQT